MRAVKASAGHGRNGKREAALTDRSNDVSAMLDEMAIRRLLDEYCLRLEINQFEDWLDLFTHDTVYDVFRQSLRGREEVAAMLSQAPHGIHLPGATRIELGTDTAQTVQSYLFLSASEDTWNAGWYQRTVVRTGEGWKIAHTRVKIGRLGNLAPEEKARMLAFPVQFA
ncbi:nuclear transport factor 2 family protein [Novosphingobium barchaimii]|uniref:nuclear transport factor 2 family protein n=1 Tax=Novosphingobium barchaimii TaxID=1420591 RepID=UPI0009E8A153|nr:nuclear transport factor 2 family protein [Novosphingobium barchaimii]